jgi:hypothetical protein
MTLQWSVREGRFFVKNVTKEQVKIINEEVGIEYYDNTEEGDVYYLMHYQPITNFGKLFDICNKNRIPILLEGL